MSRITRLLQKKNELQQAYDALTEQIGAVRTTWATETDPASKLKYEKQAEKLERDRQAIEREIDEIESMSPTDGMELKLDRIDFGLIAIAEYVHNIQLQNDRLEQMLAALLKARE